MGGIVGINEILPSRIEPGSSQDMDMLLGRVWRLCHSPEMTASRLLQDHPFLLARKDNVQLLKESARSIRESLDAAQVEFKSTMEQRQGSVVLL